MKWYVQQLDGGAWSEPEMNVSFDAMSAAELNASGWYELQPSPPPIVAFDTDIIKTLVLDGNVVKYVWSQQKKTGEDLKLAIKIEWHSVRLQRNELLQKSDWTQILDTPITAEQRAAWATYRQQLRDLTTQSDPFAIVWPTNPEGTTGIIGVVRV